MLVIKPDEGYIYTMRLGSSMVRNDITTLAFMGNSGTRFGNNIVSTQWLVHWSVSGRIPAAGKEKFLGPSTLPFKSFV